MLKIVECVPNFSEGRDMAVIDAITNEIANTDQVKLLDVDPGADTNRTVVTFIGTPESVQEAAFKAIKKASEVIDMTKHQGGHARMGATDVCPFVPVSGVTMDDCAAIAKKVGKRVAEELKIPIYLYEYAAATEERRNLANIRQGEYEGLAEKLKDPHWAPDFGEPVFNARSGATVTGAREFLIAYNVNLNTTEKKLATEIALNIREKGRLKRDENRKVIKNPDGTSQRVPGTLKECKAVGWYIEEYKQAQVSINLTNYTITPPFRAFDECCREAEKLGLRVTGSELVGLIPLEAMLEAGRHYLKKQNRSAGVTHEALIRTAIQSLGLDDISEFDPKKKIIEYAFREPRGPLVNMTVGGFADEVSMESPAPGGGSVAAVAGAMGAGLASMVANLTVGKPEYDAVQDEMKQLAEKAQIVKEKLLVAVDKDTEAFDVLMDCFRLPKKTDEQKKSREESIQEATKNAAGVPLDVMGLCLDAMKIAEIVVSRGNVNSVSDGGVGALAALTGVEGAGLNVKINLTSVTDKGFIDDMLGKADALIDRARALNEKIQKNVLEKIDGLKAEN